MAGWSCPNGWSPEHGPDEDGVSYNQEIVWDLFNNYVAGGGRARRGQGLPRQNRRDARQAGHAGHRQLGPAARMDDREARPEISRTRHAQRSSPPHVASVRGLSRRPDQRRPKRPSWRRRRRFRSTRAALRRTATCANGRSPGAPRFTRGCTTAKRAHQMLQQLVLRAEHLPESVRPASADAD